MGWTRERRKEEREKEEGKKEEEEEEEEEYTPATVPCRAYRVPVTMSKPSGPPAALACTRIMRGMNFGWCEKSASMMMMKLPVANCSPCTYAVPRPSLPARGRSCTRAALYTRCSCSATACVPSGDASSTMTISQSRLLSFVNMYLFLLFLVLLVCNIYV
jgi:hypothetical protein